MSKRKLLNWCRKNCSGWDDPRMPTIAGLRDEVLRPRPCASSRVSGVTKYNGVTDVAYRTRDPRHLNKSALRRLAVLHPIKLVTRITRTIKSKIPRR
jgi:glutaminyl-tRNA synthetase